MLLFQLQVVLKCRQGEEGGSKVKIHQKLCLWPG